MENIWVIVPAYNEAERITATIAGLRSLPQVKIMVVDDGSDDATVARAEAAGVDMLLPLGQNGGKGNALNKGIAALPAEAEVVLFIDADLGECAAEAGKLLPPVVEKQADMTIAVFPRAGKKGGFGLVKKLARNSVRLLGGAEVTAPLSGQRALSRRLVEAVFPLDAGYGIEVGLTIDAARLGYRIVEVPVMMTHNETGRDLSGFKHRGKQFWEILKTDWHKLWQRKKRN